MTCTRLFLAIFAVLLTYQIASAANPATLPTATQSAPNSLDEHTFVVSPAALPASPFTYRFDFPRNEQYDGNGVTSFLQGTMLVPSDDIMQKLEDWAATDSDATFVERMRRNAPWLDTKVPTSVDTAVRYRGVTFDFPLREQGIGVLLPFLNNVRDKANYLQYQTRFAIATGDYKQAVELIRAQLLWADETDQCDTCLVSHLVTDGVASQGVNEMHRLMERSDSPNLYWAMRRLPIPFGNIRGALHSEEVMLELTFPDLANARAGQALPAAAWKRVVDRLVELTKQYRPTASADSLDDLASGDFSPERLVEARASYARRYNHPAAEVERIEPTQVMAAFYYFSYRDALDTELKWACLPYPQALAGLAANQPAAQGQNDQPDNPFIALAGFDLRPAITTNARLDRAIAATATVEALRAYAAAHGGRLPSALADLTEAPAADNPATGRPFEYTVTGDTAVLTDPGQFGMTPLRYTVRLRHAPATMP